MVQWVLPLHGSHTAHLIIPINYIYFYNSTQYQWVYKSLSSNHFLTLYTKGEYERQKNINSYALYNKIHCIVLTKVYIFLF